MEPRDRAIALLVALGGASGAVARWGVALALPWQPPSWPMATFTVNLLGCTVIGFLLTVWIEGPTPRWWARPLVAVGFVGGFTTFSAFAVEGVRLVAADAPGTALAYVATSVVAGLLLVRAASLLARRVAGPRGGLR